PLVHTITYSAPSGSGITVPAAIGFSYDADGNRTSMTDGSGSSSYAYDQLSRITSETHHFNDLASLPSSGNYTLTYGYNLAGDVTNVTDPWGTQVGYTYDSAGRLASVTGSGTGSAATYVSSFQYRAFDAVKGATYGNGVQLSVGYTNRLQPNNY